MSIDKEKYPELYKASNVPDGEKRLLGEFCEHLQEELGIELVEFEFKDETPVRTIKKNYKIEEIICSFFDIDYEAFEKQKLEALEEAMEAQRELNKKYAS